MLNKGKGILRIDGDGTGPNALWYVLSVFKQYADVVSIEVYCKVGTPNFKRWEECSKKSSVRLIPLSEDSGKNATDIMIALQTAEDIRSKHRVGVYGIVASDYDFHPIAKEARDSGCEVVGFGYWQTPLKFQTSCSKFEMLSREKCDEAMASGVGQRYWKEATKNPGFIRFLKDSFANAAEGSDLISHACLVKEIKRQKKTLTIESDAPIKWKKLFESMELFELCEEGKTLMVRLADESKAA